MSLTYSEQVWSPFRSGYTQVELLEFEYNFSYFINRLTPKNPYMGRTAPLTSKLYSSYIY